MKTLNNQECKLGIHLSHSSLNACQETIFTRSKIQILKHQNEIVADRLEISHIKEFSEDFARNFFFCSGNNKS